MMASPARKLPRLRRPLRWLLWIVGVVALLLLGAWLAVPVIVRHVLETNVAASLRRPVKVERVEFNPLTLAARLHGVTVSGRDGNGTLFTFTDLAADLSWASVWHWAPVLDHVRLTQPHVWLRRDDDGSYSIQDLLDDWFSGPPGAPARFSFNNIEVVDGSIDFDDRPVHKQHTVRELSVGIPFLSSLAYQTTIKVQPRMAAKINGSPFALAGTTTPFARERDAALDIDLDALPLPEYVAYLPVKLRGRLTAGTLTTRAKLMFTEGESQSRSLWLSGQFTIDGASFQRANGEPVVSAHQVSVHVARLDVFNHQLVIDALALERPMLDVHRSPSGVVNLAEPFVEASAAPAPAAAASDNWRVDVEKARVNGGSLRIVDEAVKPAYRAALNNVAVEITDLSSAPDKPSHMRLSFNGDFGGGASAEFDLLPFTLEASGHAAFEKVALKRLYPYYADALNLEVQSGVADIALDFATAPGDGDQGRTLTLTAGEATISDARLALPGERTPLLHAPRVTGSGLAVDATKRRIDVALVSAAGGELNLRREADGAFNFARIVRTSTATGRAAAIPAGGKAAAAAPVDDTWTVAIKRMSVERYAVAVDDRQPVPPVALALRDVAITADDYTNARGKPMAITARAKVGAQGSLAFDGPLSTNPVAARLRVVAERIALPPLQPYVDPVANVTMTAGTLSLNGRVAFGIPDEGTADRRDRVRWNGDVTLNDFAALDKPTSSDLARWKELKLTAVDVDTEPLKVDIGSVALADFFARVIVYNDATLNFVRLLKPADGSDAAPAVVAARVPAAGTEGAPPTLPATVPSPATAARASALPASVTGTVPLTIGRIELSRGNVQYSDFYIRPNYSANLTGVAGSVSAMSATQAGNVAIAAKVDGVAPVEISGRINPLSTALLLDLTGKARDIDLPPLSPYAAKYAGYGITKGKLSFDVSYKVENRKLSANNKIVLDQLTFGDRVDSPTATKLPVLLAVALLKDVHGVIDIELPIAGSLDDPDFSVGGLIVRVIVNLLTKAVTAPFALLGAAFGGGEELSYLEFKPGVSTVDGADDVKVDKLAKALAARPALRLDLRGHVAATPDGEAMRHADVEAALRAQKVKALAAAGTAVGDPSAVVVTAAERPSLLLAAYKDAPIKERPRNFIGMLKEVPAADMEAMLYANTSVSADALAALATQRAQAVRDALVARGIASERLFIVASRSTDTAPAGNAARVDLALK